MSRAQTKCILRWRPHERILCPILPTHHSWVLAAPVGESHCGLKMSPLLEFELMELFCECVISSYSVVVKNKSLLFVSILGLSLRQQMGKSYIASAALY